MSRFYTKSAGKKMRRKLYVAILAALPCAANAVPEGGRVTAGAAEIIRAGDTLRIEQDSQRVILEFDDFSVAAQETVNFVQPNSDSVALNRVMGSDLSTIHGAINANGHVYLINPNGVLFGAGAQVNVGGLVATTLNMSDQDFLDQREQLHGAAQGLVENRGRINATARVVLVAPDVVNKGDISVPGGEATLRSSRSLLLQPSGSEIPILMDDPHLTGQVINEGRIAAGQVAMALDGQGSRDIYDNAINNRGIVRAVRASGDGGTVHLLAGSGDAVHSGEIDVSGEVNVNADGSAGGDVIVHAGRYGQTGTIEASGRGAGDGGNVAVRAEQTIAMIDNSRISANAGADGDGGEVILYADEDTWFTEGAEITARGGSATGDGGFVEVSGKDFIDVHGAVDVGAVNGGAGTWYIDPTNIAITTGSANTGTFVGPDPFNWEDSGAVGGATIGVLAIQSALMNGSVIINTASAQADAGDITVRSYIDINNLPTGRTLSLIADRDIIFHGDSGVEDASPGGDELKVVLSAGRDIMFNGGTSIDVGAATFSARANGFISVSNIISTSTSNQAIVLESLTDELRNTNLDTRIDAVNGGVVLGAATGINLFNYVNSEGLGLRHYGSGSFNYDHSGDLTLSDVGLGAGSMLNITATGSITYTGASGGDLDGATNAVLTLDADTTLSINGDLADITGVIDNSTTFNFIAGTGFSMAEGVTVHAGDGAINITTTSGNAEVSGLISTRSAADAIRVNSGGALLGVAGDGVSLSAINGGLIVNAVNGVADLATHVSQVDITAGTGDISFIEVDDVEVVRLSSGDAVNVTVGGNFLLPGVADLLANQLIVNAMGDVILPDTGLTMADVLTVSASDIYSESGTRSLVLGAPRLAIDTAASGGDLTLAATANVLDIRSRSANVFTVNSVSDILTVANSGTGIINVSDADAVTLARAEPTSGSTAVRSGAGADLVIAGGGAIDVSAGNGALTLASGNDLIVETDIVNSIGVSTPTLELSAANNVTFTDTTRVDVGAGDLAINATVGNVNLGRVSGRSVGINAGSAIVDANGTEPNITATVATLTANGDIGTALDPLDGDVAALTIDAGNVFYSNARAMSLAVAAAADLHIALPTEGDLTLLDPSPAISGTSRFDVAAGDLIITDAGLEVGGLLSVSADNLRDSDNHVILAARDASIALRDGGATQSWTTSFDTLSAAIAGAGTLTVTDADALTIDSLTTGGDATITAAGDLAVNQLNTGGDLSLDASANLTLMEAAPAIGGAFNLLVGGGLTIPDQGLQVDTALTVDAATVASASGTGATAWQASTADLHIRNSAQNDSVSAQVTQLSLRYGGTNAFTVELQDGTAISDLVSTADIVLNSPGDMQILTADAAVNGSLALRANGAVTLADAGLAFGDSLQVAAGDLLSASGGAVSLNGTRANINLSGEQALDLAGQLAQLGLTFAAASDLQVVNEGDLELTSWQTDSATHVDLSVSGVLRIPETGLEAPGRLVIDAADLLDSDRTIDLNAAQLTVRLSNSSGNNVWNLDSDQFDAFIEGQANLSVLASHDLVLQDLDGDGSAIDINNGNFTLLLSDGTLGINDNLYAKDQSADGRRGGVIDIQVAQGDIQIGQTRDFSIVSTNTVDTSASSLAGGENGIRLQLTDSSSANRKITIGGDTTRGSIGAVGGDVEINTRPGDTPVSAQRAVVTAAGTTIGAYNDINDPLTGTVFLNGAAIRAESWQRIRQGRKLALIVSVEQTPGLNDLVNDIEGIDNNTHVENAISEQSVNVTQQYDAVFGRCEELDQDSSKGCQVDAALKAFLSHWLVGGELPPKSEI